MNKFLFSALLALILVSCNLNNGNGQPEDTYDSTISTEQWPKKNSIGAKALSIISEWPEYSAMDISFDALYTVENREDLALVVEDLIEKQKLLEASEYPETFDIPQIKSRQKVFKTYFLKIKGNLEYRLDTDESVLETIAAYNALRNQFNSIANNTLDTKLIFEQ